MLRKGFVERQIEALGLALAVVFRLKERGNLAEASHELRTAGKRFTGMDTFALARLSDESLLAFLSSGDEPDAGRYILASAILREHASLLELQGQKPEADSARSKSLTLLLEAMLLGDWFRTKERRQTVESLLVDLKETELPSATHRRLFRYFEATGEFGRAEDALYEFQDTDPEWRSEARDFYARLLQLPDATLERGGLPRNEVTAGMEEASA